MTHPSGLPWGLAFEPVVDAPGIDVTLDFDPGTGILQATLVNGGTDAVELPEVRLRSPFEEPAAGGWAHLEGRYMQQDALVRRFGEPADEGYSGDHRLAVPGGEGYVSRQVAALTLPSRTPPSLLIGALRGDRFFCDIRLELDEDERAFQAIEVAFQLEGTPLEPGATLALPPVLVATGDDGWSLLEQYADAVAAEMAPRIPREVPAGWCSWYSVYGEVSEDVVLSNLEAIAGARLPLDYVQVDDGYQSHTGDWLTPNEKFPSGMAALAERIRDAGYRPGIWLAPLVLHRDSIVLAEHADYALRDTAGDLITVDTWLGPCAVLDCTHPGAEAWLREVIRTVVHEWGYTFLKLDALAFAARPGDRSRYAAAGTTAPANLRRGLEIIREAAGDDAFLLGCTGHFAPAIGLVDAMRTGPDVKTVWVDGTRPSVRHAMRMSLSRNYMHRRWWLNDPDCLLLRDTDTSLVEPEVRFLAAAVMLSGGLVVSGDDLAAISPDRLQMLRALLPPPGIAARPLDPGDGPVPSAWRADLDEVRSLVGVLNWDEEARWVSVSTYLAPGEVAFDPWTARVLGKGDILLRPHEGALWQVTRPSQAPRVVGDTGHVTFDRLHSRQVSGRLQLRNDAAEPRTVAVEARGRTGTVTLDPGEARWFD